MTTPDPIRRFVETTNAGDTQAFLDTFTDDAFLSDWGRDFRGCDGISRWNQSDNIGVQSICASYTSQNATVSIMPVSR
ncbi:nuclear transport factor 2 family protein [Mesorhizobium sp. RCC_202]|uniref:nuclear transport factor 2 family protein n=1 Tax=Mesorhizobium sp. RCC_202 TaxID=3239222 RepID=UPI0035269579